MTPPVASPHKKVWTWWSTLLLAIAYLIVPGPPRSPFSGLPLSSKATAVFVVLVLVALATAMFRPRRRPRVWWSAAILALIVVKALLAPSLVIDGWKGVYRTSIRQKHGEFGPLYVASFQTRGAAAQRYRIDRVIDFDGVPFGLSFINDLPLEYEHAAEKRDVAQPLLVEWTAYSYAEQPRHLKATVSARGRLRVDVDGRTVLDAVDPAGAAVDVAVPAGMHRWQMVYAKPFDVVPAARFVSDERVTFAPATPQQLARGDSARRWIDILGALALLLLVACWIDAYRGMDALVSEIWQHPDRVAAFGIAAVLVLWGLSQSIQSRHATMQLGSGDDPLEYAGFARQIERNGLLQVDDAGHGKAYFFYPLYSYVLAGANTLFGDDESTVFLLDDSCLAASVLLVWVLLRRRVSRGALAVVLLLVVAPVVVLYFGRKYAWVPLSDSIFLPTVLVLLLACIVAFERRSVALLALVGVCAAMGAAARPSLMTFTGVLPLFVLLQRDFGSLFRRARGIVAFALGFAAALSPFTIRNWIVAHKFVLLVSSVVELPYFLVAGGHPPPNFYNPGQYYPDYPLVPFSEALKIVWRMFVSAPGYCIWLEVKKVLYTLGFGSFALPDLRGPWWWFIFPAFFALALWLRRVPRPVAVALLAFLSSHMLAMVIAGPWSYGYKNVVPFIVATIVGGAFLLRHAGARQVVTRPVAPLPDAPELAVIGDGDGADYGAAVRRGLSEARGDLIAVVPADPAYAARDLQRLLPFAADFDLVLGRRQTEHPSTLLHASWFVAKCIVALSGSGAHLSDAGSKLWLIRRDALPLLGELRENGDELSTEVVIRAVRAGLRVIDVPISFSPAADAEQGMLARMGRSLKVLADSIRTPREIDGDGVHAGLPVASVR